MTDSYIEKYMTIDLTNFWGQTNGRHVGLLIIALTIGLIVRRLVPNVMAAERIGGEV